MTDPVRYAGISDVIELYPVLFTSPTTKNSPLSIIVSLGIYHKPPVCPTKLLIAFSGVAVPAPLTVPNPSIFLCL